MNERIKEVRKKIGLTQDELGKIIGITGAGVARIEKGASNPTEAAIKLICMKYNISETWLRTGEGDMNVAISGSAAEIAKKYSFPDITKKLLEAYERLSEEQQAIVLEYARNFIASLIDGKDLEQAAGIATSQKEQPEI